MNNMFDFFQDALNYEARNIARFEGRDGLFVDTSAVSDGSRPFETAVSHKNYNGGDLIIVEAYETESEARKGHDKWVVIMTGDKLPNELKDCANSLLKQYVNSLNT